jgi:hypothetical protein
MGEWDGSREESLARLRAAWPGWEIWVVPLWAGGARWCARAGGKLLSAHTPGELAEYLAEASGQPVPRETARVPRAVDPQ